MNHSPHTRSLAAVPARARVRARACMKRVSYHLLLDRLPVGGRLPRTSADAGATNALPHILPVRHCQKRLLVGPARSLPDVLDLFVWALEHKDVAAHGHLLALAKAAKCNHAVPLALDFLELKRAGHALQRPPCPLAVRGPATRGRRLVFGAHARAAGAPLCGRRPVRPRARAPAWQRRPQATFSEARHLQGTTAAFACAECARLRRQLVEMIASTTRGSPAFYRSTADVIFFCCF